MWLAVAANLLFLSQAPAESAAVAGAKVWLGRAAEYEEFLRTAPIERFKDIDTGVTHPRRAYFAAGGLAGSAIVKHLPPGRPEGYFESYKSEIAAYELDKLLGLDMVPPTVERRIQGDLQSAQLWVEGCQLLKQLAGKEAPDVERWNRQVYRHRVFDGLIGNIDRNAGNLLVDAQWNLILIDHSRAFTDTGEPPFEKQFSRIDKPLLEKLKALDEATLVERVGKWLPAGKSSVRSLLKRRDRIVADFEKLAKQRGEAAVFIP